MCACVRGACVCARVCACARRQSAMVVIHRQRFKGPSVAACLACSNTSSARELFMSIRMSTRTPVHLTRELRSFRFARGSISALPTACSLRGYGRAGTQNDRLSGHPRNGHAVGDAEIWRHTYRAQAGRTRVCASCALPRGRCGRRQCRRWGRTTSMSSPMPLRAARHALRSTRRHSAHACTHVHMCMCAYMRTCVHARVHVGSVRFCAVSLCAMSIGMV